MDQYQQFIHKSRYARWLPEESRRETMGRDSQQVCRLLERPWTDRREGSP